MDDTGHIPEDDDPIQRVDDYLWNEDLTVKRALSLIDESRRADFEATYRWFMEQSGEVGPRLYGKGQRLPGVSPDFAHAAQRGIHKPAGSPYALNVTITKNDLYDSDGAKIDRPAGDWYLVYAAHRNNRGGETDSQWNDSLKNCMRDGIPVGVFLAKDGEYSRYLAFVEEYRPEDETFVLHGPVTSKTEEDGLFRSRVHDYLVKEDFIELGASPEELMRDERTARLVLEKVRKGQSGFRRMLLDAYDGACAVTGFETGCTLQAAHILGHRGVQTNVVENGLLLRADIHALFDSWRIGFEPGTRKIFVADSVPDVVYQELGVQKLRFPKNEADWPSDAYLKAKFDEFKRINRGAIHCGKGRS